MLLLTPEGSDRHLLGAHWIVEGLRRGERVLALLSGEGPEAFLARLGRMGVDVSSALASGSLAVIDWHTCWTQPVKGVVEEHRTLRASRIVSDLLAAIDRATPSLLPAPGRRAFVDFLPLAYRALDEAQAAEGVTEIRTRLSEAGATSIFAAERSMPEARLEALLKTFHAVFDARGEDRSSVSLAVLGVGGVKLAPRYRRVQLSEDGAFVESEPAARSFSCPICDARVPFDAPKCPGCGTARSEMTVRAQSGIMDYVDSLGRKEGEEARGRVSAPPAREPRPPGFTNGMRPLAGRVNGTAPGRVNGTSLGRVNGVAPKGRTNGLQAAGRTNGLVNGLARARRGVTNGLTNGSGFTNGLGGSRARVEARRSRWKLYLVPLLAASLLLSPFLLTESNAAPLFSIDGVFGEWEDVRGYTQSPAPGTNRSVALTDYKVANESGQVHLYAAVNGTWFDDPDEVHALYAFIDRDGNSASGYRVQGLGADLLVVIEGSDRTATATSLREFEDADQDDWSLWRAVGTPPVAVNGGKLETSFPWSDGNSTDTKILLLADDGRGSRSYSAVAFGFDLGALRARVTGGEDDAVRIPRGTPEVLAVELEAFGGPVTVTNLILDVSNATAIPPPELPVTVEPGTTQMINVRVDTSLAQPGDLVTAEIVRVVADRPALVVGGPVRAYVESDPGVKRVEGWFGDWDDQPTPDSVGEAVDADRNIDQYAANRTGSELFLYVDVVGEIFAGSPTPVRRTKPVPGETEDAPPPPPLRVAGEDAMRVYVDVDRDAPDGVPILGLRGADLLVEIRGIHGAIVGQQAYEWQDGWRAVAAPDAANDRRRLEASLPIPASGAVEIVFESWGWDGPEDSTEVSGTRGVRPDSAGGFRSEGRFTATFDSTGRVELAAAGVRFAWTLPSSEAGGWSLAPTPVGATFASGTSEVRYAVRDRQLKEEFVLHARPTAFDGLVFPFELTSGTAWVEEGSLPRIRSDSRDVFAFAPPFALDADGTVSPLDFVLDLEHSVMRIPVSGDLLATAAYPLVIDPVVNYTLENDGASNDLGEQTGYSVAIGDFNGDGYADALTGAPSNNVGGNPHGYAYVFYGPFSADDTSPDVWINGTENSGQLGYALAAGKFNNDAYWDALVSRRSVTGLCTTCNVSIYYGSAGWSGLENTPDVNFPPPTDPKNFGWAVAAGNLNNANYDDVLISEPGKDNNADSLADGIVHVYLSPFGATESSADFTLFPSSNASGQMGQNMAVGKVDSDAYADVVVGEPLQNSNFGRFQFFKGISFTSGSGNRYPNATVSAPSGGTAGQFGKSSSVGNLNGDGYADVLVGAPTKTGNNGIAYVYLANSDGSGVSTGASPSVTLASQSSAEQFGQAVLIADFSNDGTSDAIVGAPFANAGGTRRGSLYWFDDPLADQTPDETMSGTQTDERFGWSLAAGKFASDPQTILAAGAFLWNDGSDADSGRVIVASVPEPFAWMTPLAITIPLVCWSRARRRAKSRATKGSSAGAPARNPSSRIWR